MLFPRKEEVLEIHSKLIEQFGGLPGIRDEGLLDSALLAPANRQHYEGADLATCAATYAFHLTRNHAFVDGNKRVGAAVAEIFVRLNGSTLAASNDEIVYRCGCFIARRSGKCVCPLGAKRRSAGRLTGDQAMILTREEIAFLDVYCHEGTQPPFGGPATDAMKSIGVENGDTLNLQWAYLRDQPPTSPIIGHASKVAPPLPWPNRDTVLRRDAEVRGLREEAPRATARNQRIPVDKGVA
jgi:death-on-curing protein